MLLDLVVAFVGGVVLQAAAPADGLFAGLFAVDRNTTDLTCTERRVPCSTLNHVDAATGTATPAHHNVQNLSFIQGLQVMASVGGVYQVSFSIAADPYAAAPANTVLVGVDAETGDVVSTVQLPFNHVSMMAEGMFLGYDDATGDLIVVGEMAVPPPSLPGSAANDHFLFRVDPNSEKLTAVGFFGGSDSIANVGAFDSATGIFWAQCIGNMGRTYNLIGIDAQSGEVVQNLTDPYMAAGMACGGGRCFLIGITHTFVRAGTFERVLVELTCTARRHANVDGNGNGDADGRNNTSALACTISAEPLLRLPTVCLMFGGVMTLDAATSTIYGVLQNNSAASPCGGGGADGADFVRWGVPATTDTGWKLLGVSYLGAVPKVVGEPLVCASQGLCPISIAASAQRS